MPCSIDMLGTPLTYKQSGWKELSNLGWGPSIREGVSPVVGVFSVDAAVVAIVLVFKIGA